MALRRADRADTKRRARVLAAESDQRFPRSLKAEPSFAGRDAEEASGWTVENRAKILELVSNGNPPSTAVIAVVGSDKLAIWVGRAKRQEDDFVEFFQRLKMEEKKALVRWEGMLETAARGDTLKIPTGRTDEQGQPVYRETTPDVKAIQFLLERRDPRHFGKTSKLEHSGLDGAPLAATPFRFSADFKDWTDEEILEFTKSGRRPARLATIAAPLSAARGIEREFESMLSSIEG